MDSSKRNVDSSLFLLLPNNITPNDESYIVIMWPWDLFLYSNVDHLCRKNMKVAIK